MAIASCDIGGAMIRISSHSFVTPGLCPDAPIITGSMLMRVTTAWCRLSWSVLATALVTAACAMLNDTPPSPVPTPTSAPAPQAQSSPSQPGPKSSAPTRHASARPHPSLSKKEEPVPVAVDSMLGQSEADIVKRLGPPSSQTEQAPAKLLVFTADGCALDVYVFPNMAQGDFRALEVRASGGLPAGQCLARILAAAGPSDGRR